MNYADVVDYISRVMDISGILVIVFGMLFVSIYFFSKWSVLRDKGSIYKLYRQNLERVILLGIEFLVAGDIIHSIAVTPNLDSIVVLGLIIAIRTVLSIELNMEIEGKWPWQRSVTSSETK